jgi:large subunit ribosomal protein L31
VKTEIHPEYHPVLFVDLSSGYEFLTNSTMTSEERRDVDGIEAYVVRLDITADSHPFFTGEQRIVDTAGRVERFRRRYERSAETEAVSDDATTEGDN